MNGQLKLKEFNLDNINMNPRIVIIQKRPSGKAFVVRDILNKDKFYIEFELRIGKITRKNN